MTGRLILRLLPAAGIAGLLAVASVVAALPGSEDATAATEAAARDIPPDMLALYREAATICPGLPWSVLAALGSVESAHGRNAGESSAGALRRRRPCRSIASVCFPIRGSLIGHKNGSFGSNSIRIAAWLSDWRTSVKKTGSESTRR